MGMQPRVNRAAHTSSGQSVLVMANISHARNALLALGMRRGMLSGALGKEENAPDQDQR